MFIFTTRDIIDLIILVPVIVWLIAWLAQDCIKKAKCKHDEGVNETSSCDAICKKCGKNLGFIGNWRGKS